jgi:hypothetical protein
MTRQFAIGVVIGWLGGIAGAIYASVYRCGGSL